MPCGQGRVAQGSAVLWGGGASPELSGAVQGFQAHVGLGLAELADGCEPSELVGRAQGWEVVSDVTLPSWGEAGVHLPLGPVGLGTGQVGNRELVLALLWGRGVPQAHGLPRLQKLEEQDRRALSIKEQLQREHRFLKRRLEQLSAQSLERVRTDSTGSAVSTDDSEQGGRRLPGAPGWGAGRLGPARAAAWGAAGM